MPSKQIATPTCRLVSLWFFFHAGLNLFSIPGDLWSAFLLAYLRNIANLPKMNYFRFGSLFTPLVYFSVELAVGVFFYRCGPAAVKFLFGTRDEAAPNPGD